MYPGRINQEIEMLSIRLGLALILLCCSLTSVAQERARQQADISGGRAEMSQSTADTGATQNQRKRLENGIETLNGLIKRKPPSDLDKRQRAEWNEQTKWLESVKSRYKRMHEKYPTARQKTSAKDMEKLNKEFLALQNAIQQESRKFQTLSNASKARHDIAMNAIRNMKA